MAIHPIEFRYGSSEMRGVFEETARLQKLLDVEAALARAHGEVGNIPAQDARIISEAASTDKVKVARVKEIEAKTRHDIMAVVKALTEVCGRSGKYIHLGATSYDIVDTANALQFKDALGIVESDLLEIEGEFLRLAEEKINLVAVGRTHGQHAVPITYGLKFALWAREVRRNITRLNEGKKRFYTGKMSGAVGSQASFGEKGPAIQAIVMDDLGLVPAMVSNQVVQRDSYAELLSLLAIICASMEKFSKEVRNLMRTEIAEVSEGYDESSQVGSSTMPHKRNPITAEKVCGLARVVRANLSVALENVALEHERDLTNSSAERAIIGESFILTDEILKSTKSIFKNLVFHPENIKRNLELSRGLNLAEAVMIKLVDRGLGRQDAHELLRRLSVKAVSEDTGLEDVLLQDSDVTGLLSPDEIRDALRPENYIGTAVYQVREVLKRSKAERG
ncbi:adenylosuccinate lyase [archaeon BMS3Abin16]|nr:adenylosuccinate lyase [archaeon BMS3Abin16]HDY73992.1 adenylosuccinate lyase [Euryarchaeota archaeon]